MDLTKIKTELTDIETFLARPDAFSAPDFAAKSKRASLLREIVNLDAKITQDEANLKEAEELVNDPELGEIAKEDIKNLKTTIATNKEKLEELLIPRDPADDKPAIIEIRAGAGGDEASLFAGELYRMYLKYAENHGLKSELISKNENEAGGMKEVIFKVSGDNAYGQLKFEGGVHRVQRVPATETQGRIHTSTATVAVLPEAEEVDVEIRPEDLRIETCRAGGAGGQHVNRTESAVQIFHLPTGIMVRCEDGRSQLKNKETGLRILRARLFEMKQREAQQNYSAQRRALIGSGGREEKIRTYNFPQNRLTDHRIGYTAYNLDIVVNSGALDDIISRMQHAEMQERMDELK